MVSRLNPHAGLIWFSRYLVVIFVFTDAVQIEDFELRHTLRLLLQVVNDTYYRPGYQG